MCQLIQLPEYNIIVNEEVKLYDKVIRKDNVQMFPITALQAILNNKSQYYKVIAQKDEIDYSMLSKEYCKNINFEKLYKENTIKTRRVFHDEELYKVHKQGFIEGLKFKKESSQPKIFNIKGIIKNNKFKITKICN
jgi:hypothetical protein